MEAINELIRHYGLEEDGEHVIIPVRGSNGRLKRIFLLKRRFIRIVYPNGHHEDFPLELAIEATVKYPDLLLSEALYLLHKEREMLMGANEEGATPERTPEED